MAEKRYTIRQIELEADGVYEAIERFNQKNPDIGFYEALSVEKKAYENFIKEVEDARKSLSLFDRVFGRGNAKIDGILREFHENVQETEKAMEWVQENYLKSAEEKTAGILSHSEECIKSIEDCLEHMPELSQKITEQSKDLSKTDKEKVQDNLAKFSKNIDMTDKLLNICQEAADEVRKELNKISEMSLQDKSPEYQKLADMEKLLLSKMDSLKNVEAEYAMAAGRYEFQVEKLKSNTREKQRETSKIIPELKKEERKGITPGFADKLQKTVERIARSGKLEYLGKKDSAYLANSIQKVYVKIDGLSENEAMKYSGFQIDDNVQKRLEEKAGSLLKRTPAREAVRSASRDADRSNHQSISPKVRNDVTEELAV